MVYQRFAFFSTIFVGLVVLGVISLGYKGETALFPLIVIVVGIGVVALKLLTLIKPELRPFLDPQGFFDSSRSAISQEMDRGDNKSVELKKNWTMELAVIGWGFVLVLCIYVLGFLVSSAVCTFLFVRFLGKRRTFIALMISASIPAFLYLLFDGLLRIDLYSGLLF